MKKFSDLNKKQQSSLRNYFRYCIQLVFFILTPGGFVGAFAGLKKIFSQFGENTAITITPFTIILISLVVFTIVFGRFFCGFACPFGSISDWLYDFSHFIAKKLKIKLPGLNEPLAAVLKYFKYIVLLCILILCYTGIYDKLQGSSPWDVFSRITSLNFNLRGYGIGVIILALTLVAMIFERRFFCRFICPMGAVFSLLPILPVLTLSRNRENCISTCKGCKTICPCNVDLPDTNNLSVSGECIMCQKCISTCPKQNIHSGMKKIFGNSFIFTIIRALILLGLLLYLGL